MSAAGGGRDREERLICGNGAAEQAPCHVAMVLFGRRMWRPAVHALYRIRAVSAGGQSS